MALSERDLQRLEKLVASITEKFDRLLDQTGVSELASTVRQINNNLADQQVLLLQLADDYETITTHEKRISELVGRTNDLLKRKRNLLQQIANLEDEGSRHREAELTQLYKKVGYAQRESESKTNLLKTYAKFDRFAKKYLAGLSANKTGNGGGLLPHFALTDHIQRQIDLEEDVSGGKAYITFEKGIGPVIRNTNDEPRPGVAIQQTAAYKRFGRRGNPLLAAMLKGKAGAVPHFALPAGALATMKVVRKMFPEIAHYVKDNLSIDGLITKYGQLMGIVEGLKKLITTGSLGGALGGYLTGSMKAELQAAGAMMGTVNKTVDTLGDKFFPNAKTAVKYFANTEMFKMLMNMSGTVGAAMRMAVKNIESSVKIVQDSRKHLGEYDDGMRRTMRELGIVQGDLTNAALVEQNKFYNAVKDADHRLIERGVMFPKERMLEVQRKFVELSGKRILFNQQDFETIGEMGAKLALTDDELAGMLDQFRLIGRDVANVNDIVRDVLIESSRAGLNANDVLKDLTANMGRLGTLNFRGGVKDMAKMVANAKLSRMNVEAVYDLLNDTTSVEGAMDFAVKMKNLGFDVNALDIFRKAHIDPEGLAADIHDMLLNDTRLGSDAPGVRRMLSQAMKGVNLDKYFPTDFFNFIPQYQKVQREWSSSMNAMNLTQEKKMQLLKFGAGLSDSERAKMTAQQAYAMMEAQAESADGYKAQDANSVQDWHALNQRLLHTSMENVEMISTLSKAVAEQAGTYKALGDALYNEMTKNLIANNYLTTIGLMQEHLGMTTQQAILSYNAFMQGKLPQVMQESLDVALSIFNQVVEEQKKVMQETVGQTVNRYLDTVVPFYADWKKVPSMIRGVSSSLLTVGALASKAAGWAKAGKTLAGLGLKTLGRGLGLTNFAMAAYSLYQGDYKRAGFEALSGAMHLGGTVAISTGVGAGLGIGLHAGATVIDGAYAYSDIKDALSDEAPAQANVANNGGTPAKYALGGVVRGPSHEEGGIDMVHKNTGKVIGNMEGNEIIMSGGVMRDPFLRSVASLVNEMGGGAAFAETDTAKRQLRTLVDSYEPTVDYAALDAQLPDLAAALTPELPTTPKPQKVKRPKRVDPAPRTKRPLRVERLMRLPNVHTAFELEYDDKLPMPDYVDKEPMVPMPMVPTSTPMLEYGDKLPMPDYVDKEPMVPPMPAYVLQDLEHGDKLPVPDYVDKEPIAPPMPMVPSDSSAFQLEYGDKLPMPDFVEKTPLVPPMPMAPVLEYGDKLPVPDYVDKEPIVPRFPDAASLVLKNKPTLTPTVAVPQPVTPELKVRPPMVVPRVRDLTPLTPTPTVQVKNITPTIEMPKRPEPAKPKVAVNGDEGVMTRGVYQTPVLRRIAESLNRKADEGPRTPSSDVTETRTVHVDVGGVVEHKSLEKTSPLETLKQQANLKSGKNFTPLYT